MAPEEGCNWVVEVEREVHTQAVVETVVGADRHCIVVGQGVGAVGLVRLMRRKDLLVSRQRRCTQSWDY